MKLSYWINENSLNICNICDFSMKGYAVIKTGQQGWINIDEPVAGPLDAICKPIAVAPYSSDTHAMHAEIDSA